MFGERAGYRAQKHPDRPGDGWVVWHGLRMVNHEPLAYTEAVILAERLNMHSERQRHWESETLNPKENA